MTLRETMAGAMPDIDITGQPPGRAWRPRLKRWTTERIADAIGVGELLVRQCAREDPEVARLLRAPGGRFAPHSDNGLTAEGVRAAGLWILAHHLGQWSRKHRAARCRGDRCATPDAPHEVGGLCKPCYSRALRAAAGTAVRPFPGAWDTTTGADHCRVCRRGAADGAEHHSRGLCGRCDDWRRAMHIDALPPSRQRIEAARRRGRLAARTRAARTKSRVTTEPTP